MRCGDVIKERRSIRKFRSKSVPFEKIMDCIDIARWVPTPSNLQNVRFIVVQDKKKIDLIAPACAGQQWIASAPGIIVICNDPEKIIRDFDKLGKKYAEQSAAAAAMLFMLAAHEQKLATCWVGAFDEKVIRRELRIPDNVIPEIVIPLGYANESARGSRLTADLVTFFDDWDNRYMSHSGVMKNLSAGLRHKIKSINKKGNLP